ncbi:MAG: 5' nucleotidase, NT5C type [Microthrixaceae bacterium]
MAAEFILGVDLDGVCADYTAAFRDAVASHRGIDPTELTDEVSWDYGEWGLDRDGFLEHHTRAVTDEDMFARMNVIDGCSEALWRLSDAGVWIRIITHRLVGNWAHAKVVADTVQWLDDNGIPYRDLCFLGAKPQVEAAVYIDDAPHNVGALRDSGNTVIVFDQPYNQELDGPRATGWSDVEAIIAQLMSETSSGFRGQLPGMDAGTDRIERRRDS